MVIWRIIFWRLDYKPTEIYNESMMRLDVGWWYLCICEKYIITEQEMSNLQWYLYKTIRCNEWWFDWNILSKLAEYIAKLIVIYLGGIYEEWNRDKKIIVAIYRTYISLFPTTGECFVVLNASAVESFPIPALLIPGFI